MNSKQFAILAGRWLAGEPEPVLFVTLTLGSEWEGFRLPRERKAAGGMAEAARIPRDCPDWDPATRRVLSALYLFAGDCGGDRIQACWLVRSAPTRALPQGQDCEAMPSEAAVINYAVRHYSMRSRQSGEFGSHMS